MGHVLRVNSRPYVRSIIKTSLLHRLDCNVPLTPYSLPLSCKVTIVSSAIMIYAFTISLIAPICFISTTNIILHYNNYVNLGYIELYKYIHDVFTECFHRLNCVFLSGFPC